MERVYDHVFGLYLGIYLKHVFNYVFKGVLGLGVEMALANDCFALSMNF